MTRSQSLIYKQVLWIFETVPEMSSQGFKQITVRLRPAQDMLLKLLFNKHIRYLINRNDVPTFAIFMTSFLRNPQWSVVCLQSSLPSQFLPHFVKPSNYIPAPADAACKVETNAKRVVVSVNRFLSPFIVSCLWIGDFSKKENLKLSLLRICHSRLLVASFRSSLLFPNTAIRVMFWS